MILKIESEHQKMLSSNMKRHKRNMNKLSLMKVFFVLIHHRIVQRARSGMNKNYYINHKVKLYVYFREVRIVDKITDLPVSYSKYISERRPSSRAAKYEYYTVPAPVLTTTEPATHYRSMNLNSPG